MSDLLVHWAIFEDTRRLAQQDPDVEPLMAHLLDQEREIARLGALSRWGRSFVPRIINQARTAWTTAADTDRLGKKVAYALGGITHYAADVILKPVMSRLAQAEWNATHHALQGREASEATQQSKASIREISAYYDIEVFRQVYLAGQEEPFSHFLVAGNDTAPGQAMEAFVRALFQRALLSSHTLSPDREDFDTWLDSLIDQVQPLYLDIALYTQVFTNPDPQKTAQYGVTSEFYRQDDDLILLARAVQGGERLTPGTLDTALANQAGACGYSRALALSITRLRETSAYWRGEHAEWIDLKQ